jgi:three-Cys-motif partner protein
VKPSDTLWPIEPHTEKKHELLRKYIEAWLPIVGRFSDRVVYIDGFAGPGTYSGCEDGSPLVVLKTARDHAHANSELICIFIEADADRYAHLENILSQLSPPLPPHIRYKVVKGSFTKKLPEALDLVTQQRARRQPLFAFVDPFGMSHTPLETVEEILKAERSEVLINFMFEEINRFLAIDELAANHDALFGTDKWRALTKITNSVERRSRIHDLYRDQLSKFAKYVRSFEMCNKQNRTDYFLFFATNSLKGLEKMKDAMWKVDSTGFYQFSDKIHFAGQLSFFSDNPQYDILEKMILADFGGKTVTVEQLEEWVIEETPFRRAHLKKPVLAPMEAADRLTVMSPLPSRRRGTFPDGTRIHFIAE